MMSASAIIWRRVASPTTGRAVHAGQFGNLKFGENQFLCASAISPRFYGSAYLYLFNRDLTADLGMPDLYELVREGVSGKLARLPEDVRAKMRESLEKIINEGTGGMICILL